MTAAVSPVSPASPVRAGEVLSAVPFVSAVVRYPVDADDPIFAGHYPGFPIYPGVCLVECVHRAATETAGEPVRLVAVESTRFIGATFPGDTITVALTWKPAGEGWTVTAEVSSGRGVAANVRLRYARAES